MASPTPASAPVYEIVPPTPAWRTLQREPKAKALIANSHWPSRDFKRPEQWTADVAALLALTSVQVAELPEIKDQAWRYACAPRERYQYQPARRSTLIKTAREVGALR